MDKFFNWETLGTLTGVSTATGLITQVIKAYIPIPTQIVAYIIACLILVFSAIYKQEFKNIPLCLVNGFIVASISSNTFDLVTKFS